MSILDIRETPLVFALFCLQNERDEMKKQEILKQIQDLINRLKEDDMLSMFRKYYSLKNNATEHIEKNQADEHIEKNQAETNLKSDIRHLKIANECVSTKDCEDLIKKLGEKKNSPFKRDVEYTKYLMACDDYQSKTGKQLSHDTVQSIDVENKKDTTPVNSPVNLPSSNIPIASSEKQKSPVFIDKKGYKNGGVTTYRGINFDDFIKLEEAIVTELNSKNPGSLEFKKTDRGWSIMGKTEQAFAQFEKLRDEKLQQEYQIFSHAAEKQEKDIPEKYRLPSDEEKISYTNKLTS